jgi:hypothetical protein
VEAPLAPPLAPPLALAGATASLVVEVRRMRALGLEPYLRIELADSTVVPLDTMAAVCRRDPLEHVVRVAKSTREDGVAWLASVDLDADVGDALLDCLARSVTDARAETLGALAVLRLAPDTVAANLAGTLVIGSDEGVDRAGRGEAARAVLPGSDDPTVLVFTVDATLLDLRAAIRHEGGALALRVGVDADDTTTRFGYAVTLDEAARLLGRGDRARAVLRELGAARISGGGARREVEVELHDLAAVAEAGAEALRRWPQVDAERRLREWARLLESHLEATYYGPCTEPDPVPPAMPGTVPRRVRYEDWFHGAGGAPNGWLCYGGLGFDGIARHQYTLRVGGGYKGPPRGGPDPGPHGVELAAESDLDGDGRTGLVTVALHPGARGGDIVVDPVFVDDAAK